MTPARQPIIAAARRTAVVPRNGAFRHLQADELAAPVIRAVLEDAGLTTGDVDQVILGNALYGGGNPARLAALRAGLPETVPALTLDTQCCSGLDAILLASRLVESGAADCVLAGGTESFSRSAMRLHRPKDRGAPPVAYDRPPFSPWPERDPDLMDAAASLAGIRGLTRVAQANFAVASHAAAQAHARADGLTSEILPLDGQDRDAFSRDLGLKAALRVPVLAGDAATGITAATAAVEADGAAVVLVLSADAARRRRIRFGLKVLAGLSLGGDPADPALVPVAAVRALAARLDREPDSFGTVELMEAYASQAMATIADLKLDPARVNARGGALSRGHPIGASGAILVVRLFHELARAGSNKTGLAAIAAAGGLATAIAVAGF